MRSLLQRQSVGVVGAGNVGVAAAFGLFNRRIASELILVDSDNSRAEGEAMDLMHGQALVGRVAVRAGSYSDLASAQLVVLTAGSAQRPGEAREALLARNVKVFRSIAEQLDVHAPRAIVIVATNPVDTLTYVMQELSSRPHDHVIGTGTMLDSARFRALLGAHYGVDPRSVHAYVIGEHGDSEVPVWSNAQIGGVSIQRPVRGIPYEPEHMNRLFEQVRCAAAEIIERKGFTSTGIGLVIQRLVQAILTDQNSVMPVSVRAQGAYGLPDVCLSLPAVVGIDGVAGKVLPDLNDAELEGLRRSAELLRSRVRGLVGDGLG